MTPCDHGTPGCRASNPHERGDCYSDDVARGDGPATRIADLEHKIAALEADRLPFAERYAEVIRRDLAAARAEAEQARRERDDARAALPEHATPSVTRSRFDEAIEQRDRDRRDAADARAALDEILVLMDNPSIADKETCASLVATFGKRGPWGAVMHAASILWREDLSDWNGHDLRGGEFVVGPCRATLEKMLAAHARRRTGNERGTG